MWLGDFCELAQAQQEQELKSLIELAQLRPADFIIGDPDEPYMKRWWLVPRDVEADQNVYLHKIIRDDDDRALHDHPWPSVSIVLHGTLREVLPEGERLLKPGSVVRRNAKDAHRLEVVDGPVWTLFVTGRREREWGFHCPNGWVHWENFVNPNNPGEVGPGCGD